MATRVQLGGDEAVYVAEVLERELRRLKKRLAAVRRELSGLEKQYGMSTEEFLSMYARAERGEEEAWRLPEEADSDAIEWYGLAQLERSLASEVERLEKIVLKMKRLER